MLHSDKVKLIVKILVLGTQFLSKATCFQEIFYPYPFGNSYFLTFYEVETYTIDAHLQKILIDVVTTFAMWPMCILRIRIHFCRLQQNLKKKQKTSSLNFSCQGALFVKVSSEYHVLISKYSIDSVTHLGVLIIC